MFSSVRCVTFSPRAAPAPMAGMSTLQTSTGIPDFEENAAAGLTPAAASDAMPLGQGCAAPSRCHMACVAVSNWHWHRLGQRLLQFVRHGVSWFKRAASRHDQRN